MGETENAAQPRGARPFGTADETGAPTNRPQEEPTSCRADVVIAGCGVAGLYCALNLPRELQVTMLSKGPLEQCDSMLAQGGICVLPEPGDYASFFADTMAAGHWENRRESVDAMIRTSRSVIDDLVRLGVDFERGGDGGIAYTREGAHARARICYHADVTGREITTKLLARVQALPNVRVLEYVEMVDITEAHDGARRCTGVVCRRTQLADPNNPELGVVPTGEPFRIEAAACVWACGGIGGTYDRSTNFPLLTGDACRIARARGIALEHMDYVQIHPTGLYSEKPGRVFLISESCRGEGAVLLDARGRRFCNELEPRDVVAANIKRQMENDGTKHVWLSFAAVSPEVIRSHFANIRAHCLEEGYDILSEPIPVVPTQHYFMGGVRARTSDSATDLPGLYAVGETSCNGVHGKNRLASNSLLESLVFASRAAAAIARDRGLGGNAPELERDIDPELIRSALEGTGPLAAPSHTRSAA